MATFFVILLIVVCVILGFIVLIQNPKGGGLSSNIGGFSTQFMGVKQTTDVLEKGTWIFAAVVALLCLFSVFFMPQGSTLNGPDRTKDATGASVPATKPATPAQAIPVAPAPTPTTPAPTK